MKIASTIVAIPNANVDKLYDYLADDNIDIQEGTRVVVPFGMGNIKVCGYVIEVKTDSQVSPQKLKKVIGVIDDTPVITKDMLEIAGWMKDKYFTTYARCLQCVLPAGIKSKKTMSKKVKFAQLTDNQNIDIEALSVQYAQNPKLMNQWQIIELLRDNGKTGVNEIKDCLFVSDSPFNTLKKKGIIDIFYEEVKRDHAVNTEAFLGYEEVQLNQEQQRAFDSLKSLYQQGEFSESLIYGVTGSGKTEIYLRLIEETIKSGKQAIMLVPEISLTPQTVARFTLRFGDNVTVTHSKMSLGERYDQWKKALEGNVRVMVGPRSAVFAPFNNLGIIIIDEEHEHSYKSDFSPKYDAREVAAKRMMLVKGPLIMGTATPSVETFYRAKKGQIKLFELTKRARDNPMPHVTVVDMREELMQGNRTIFSTLLKNEIETCLSNKEQIILFLNRRGFASFVSCRRCGHVITCENCNVSYTYHKYGEKLACHYCGATSVMPKACPNCLSPYIKQFGAGTQKIEKIINELFPEAVTIRMDMDSVSNKNSHNHILSQFAEGKADILIGTQMIAKGHDFGNVTLVGIVAADISLNGGDFRCAETTFQLMTQVSGRAGRANIPGKVVAQTYNPWHYAIEYAKTQDYKGFYEEEIKIRKSMMYPPFTHLFVVQMTGENEKNIIVLMHQLKSIMEHYKYRGDYEPIGPAPCAISKIKGKYRWRIIVKSVNEKKLGNFCIYCVDSLKKQNPVDGITINLTLNPNRIE